MTSSYVPNELTCPDGLSHVLDEERSAVVETGAMEGDWIVTGCKRCNTGMLRRADGEPGLENLLAVLRDVKPLGA